MLWTFFANITGLPGYRNKRKSVLEISDIGKTLLKHFVEQGLVFNNWQSVAVQAVYLHFS